MRWENKLFFDCVISFVTFVPKYKKNRTILARIVAKTLGILFETRCRGYIAVDAVVLFDKSIKLYAQKVHATIFRCVGKSDQIRV